jgi:predicted dinucleotide-binding enzyme
MREKKDYEALAGRLGDAVKGKVIIDATNPLTAPPALEVMWDKRSGEEGFRAGPC